MNAVKPQSLRRPKVMRHLLGEPTSAREHWGLGAHAGGSRNEGEGRELTFLGHLLSARYWVKYSRLSFQF